MKKSRYFSELLKTYLDEVDDLVTDSEGKSVLQRRLNEKRREIKAILPMIEIAPEMVAVAFYGAFGFASTEVMQKAALSEPGRFPLWSQFRKALSVQEWADPLIKSALQVDGGDDFLVTTAVLEFLRTRDLSAAAAPEVEKESRDNDGRNDEEEDEEQDLSEAGAGWLSEQGFDSLEH